MPGRPARCWIGGSDDQADVGPRARGLLRQFGPIEKPWRAHTSVNSTAMSCPRSCKTRNPLAAVSAFVFNDQCYRLFHRTSPMDSTGPEDGLM